MSLEYLLPRPMQSRFPCEVITLLQLGVPGRAKVFFPCTMSSFLVAAAISAEMRSILPRVVALVVALSSVPVKSILAWLYLWTEFPCCQCPIQVVKFHPHHPVSPLQNLTEALVIFCLYQVQEGDQEDWLAVALGAKAR